MIEFQEVSSEYCVINRDGRFCGRIDYIPQNAKQHRYQLRLYAGTRIRARGFLTLEAAQRRAEELLKGGDAHV